MKLFIRNISIFIITILGLVFLQFVILKSILNHNTDYKMDNDTTILILGDSHIEAGLNDSIIKNSINFSTGGSPVFFNYVKLKKIIENNRQIKTVVLGYSPINMSGGGFYEAPKMKSMLVNYFYLIDWKDYNDIAKYNFQGLINGITGIFRSFNKPNFFKNVNVKNSDLGGFRKLPINTIGLLEKDIKNEKLKTGKPDKISTKYFLKIIEFCKNNKIHLIVLNTPVHESLIRKSKQRREEYYKFIRMFNSDFEFWDYEDLHFDNKYFYDENHLNYKGAELFSNMINNKLKK